CGTGGGCGPCGDGGAADAGAGAGAAAEPAPAGEARSDLVAVRRRGAGTDLPPNA
ncbi:biotin synthase BioB, partial [Streptomyces sp. SCA3-4]|nr:biotin synthase BioB [Streptomyces sichuanensis]